MQTYADLETRVQTASQFLANRDYKAAFASITTLRCEIIQTASRLQALSQPQGLEQREVGLITLKNLTASSRYGLDLLNNFCDSGNRTLSHSVSEGAESVELELANAIKQLQQTVDFYSKQIKSSEAFINECLIRGIKISRYS
jgi:hypothetical protein